MTTLHGPIADALYIGYSPIWGSSNCYAVLWSPSGTVEGSHILHRAESRDACLAWAIERGITLYEEAANV